MVGNLWGKKNRQTLTGLSVGCVFPVDDSAKVESTSVSLEGSRKPSQFVTLKGEFDHKVR